MESIEHTGINPNTHGQTLLFYKEARNTPCNTKIVSSANGAGQPGCQYAEGCKKIYIYHPEQNSSLNGLKISETMRNSLEIIGTEDDFLD